MTIMDENVNWMKLEHIYVVNHFSRLNKTTHFFWCIIRILFNLVMEIPIEEIEEIQYLMNFGLTEIVFMVFTDGISCSESIVTSSHVSLVNCNISLYQFLQEQKLLTLPMPPSTTTFRCIKDTILSQHFYEEVTQLNYIVTTMKYLEQ